MNARGQSGHRTERLARWLRNWSGRHTGLSLLLLVYFSLYMALLIAGDFVPYVLDNNESFSTFNHARNLIEFGIAESKGLADEATSPSPSAHPFVHTHQGNMPRLFAAVLYLVGLQSVESQIIATTFALGTVVVIMAFQFYRLCAGTNFALLACFLLITDYIFFAQWQVNTYRIWIHFFLFSSLLSAEIYAHHPKWPYLFPVWINSLFLFYFELSFVCFTSVMTGLYLAWRLRNNWRHVVGGWLAFGLGGILSLSVLLLQGAAYLGWQDLITDARLTYFARNFGQSTEDYLALLKSFYQERNVVFFYNIASAGKQGFWSEIWYVLIGRHVQVMTSFISAIVVIAVAGFALRRLSGWLAHKHAFTERAVFVRRLLSAAAVALTALVAIQLVWLSDLWSLRTSSGSTGADLAGAITTALLIGLVVTAMPRIIRLAAPATRTTTSASRVICTCAFLLIVLVWFFYDSDLLSRLNKILWLESLSLPGGWLLHSVALIAATTAWLISILLPHSEIAPPSKGRQLGPFFATGVIAAIAVSLLFPGYMKSGYLDRGETFLIAHISGLVAFALYSSLSLTREMVNRASVLALAAQRSLFARNARKLFLAIGILSSFAALVTVGQWAHSQIAFIRMIPPNQLSWMKKLQDDDFRNASVVSNNYSAPFAVATGGWSYIDTTFATGSVASTVNGFQSQRSDIYLWLADSRINTEYLEPDLFVCFIGPTLDRAALSLDGQNVPGCRQLGLVKTVLDNRWHPFEHKLKAIGEAAVGSWAIVKLDWRAAPFLRPFVNGKRRRYVSADFGAEPQADRRLYISYRYAQQNGLPETGSILRVYRADIGAKGCAIAPAPVAGTRPNELLIERKGVAAITLPDSKRSTVVVSVQPASATRVGQEYFSDVISLGDKHGTCR